MKHIDKESIIKIILKSYEPIDHTHISNIDGAQLINGQWYIPVWGCDTIDHIIDNLCEVLIYER